MVLREVAAAQCRRAVRGALDELGATAAAVVVAGTADMLGCVPDALRVFYGTDDFVAGAGLMGLRTVAVQRAERRQLAKADIVLAVSEALCRRWRRLGAEPVLFPNGADVEALSDIEHAEPASDVDLPTGPVAGVVGHLSERLDLEILTAVADRAFRCYLSDPPPGPLGSRGLTGSWPGPACRPQAHGRLPRSRRTTGAWT